MQNRTHATPPNPDRLRREVKSMEDSLPGRHEGSTIQLGCEGCENQVGHASGLHTLADLQLMMKEARDGEGTPVPAAFVIGRFTCVSVAEGCPVDQESHKPICRLDKQAMNTILANAFKSAHEAKERDDD